MPQPDVGTKMRNMLQLCLLRCSFQSTTYTVRQSSRMAPRLPSCPHCFPQGKARISGNRRHSAACGGVTRGAEGLGGREYSIQAWAVDGTCQNWRAPSFKHTCPMLRATEVSQSSGFVANELKKANRSSRRYPRGGVRCNKPSCTFLEKMSSQGNE